MLKIESKKNLKSFFKGLNTETVEGVALWTANGERTTMSVQIKTSKNDNDNFFTNVEGEEDVFIYPGSFYDQLAKKDFDTDADYVAKVEVRVPAELDEETVTDAYTDNERAISNWKKGVSKGYTRLYLVKIEELED